MRLHRPQAYGGFLIIGLLALVGFAAFSATGLRAAPPVDIPNEASARVAGAILGLDLGPDAAPISLAAEPTTLPPQPQPESEQDTPPPPPAAPTTQAPPATAAPATAAPTTAPPTTAPPTTAAPTTTTTTASPYPPGVVGGTRNAEEWRELVELFFPDEQVDEALSVIACESQGDPLAQHPVTLATGLFQFIPDTWHWASANAGFAGHSAYEPDANVAAAAWLVAATITSEHPDGPWAHWSCQPDVPAD